MVSHSIPMGYESLKSVLLHTDPNLRFKIAQRIPEIRLTEKAVTLRIESLSLNGFETVINSQIYRLGVYRHYHTEDIPMSIKRENNEGGSRVDLDQYGFMISNTCNPILHGDVLYRTEITDDIQTDRERRGQHYQNSLRRYEVALAKINQLEREGKTIEEFLAGPMTADDQRIRDVVKFGKEHIQMKIDVFRCGLLSLHYRRHNLAPPFTCFIQLTNTQGDVKTIQRYEYNHKIYEATKKLNEILFANRPVIIVNQFQSATAYVLRIPIGLKISANSVYGYNNQIVPFSSILDSSRTLRRLDIHFVEDDFLNFQHSLAKSAEKVSICTFKAKINMLARSLGTLENQQVEITVDRMENSTAIDYFRLMHGWLSTERSVGSVITFGLRTDQIGEEILELVRTRNERTESTDRCVTVLRSNVTSLQVSYAPLPEEINLHGNATKIEVFHSPLPKEVNLTTFILTVMIIKA
ncbi:unnamed protein product [Caenorhabditis nigoni]